MEIKLKVIFQFVDFFFQIISCVGTSLQYVLHYTKYVYISCFLLFKYFFLVQIFYNFCLSLKQWNSMKISAIFVLKRNKDKSHEDSFDVKKWILRIPLVLLIWTNSGILSIITSNMKRAKITPSISSFSRFN